MNKLMKRAHKVTSKQNHSNHGIQMKITMKLRLKFMHPECYY